MDVAVEVTDEQRTAGKPELVFFVIYLFVYLVCIVYRNAFYMRQLRGAFSPRFSIHPLHVVPGELSLFNLILHLTYNNNKSPRLLQVKKFLPQGLSIFDFVRLHRRCPHVCIGLECKHECGVDCAQSSAASPASPSKGVEVSTQKK